MSVVRIEYLIDRYHVVFDSGGGWYCVCAEFKQLGDCRHIRESVGRRTAQAQIMARVRSVDGTLAGFAHRPEPASNVVAGH